MTHNTSRRTFARSLTFGAVAVALTSPTRGALAQGATPAEVPIGEIEIPDTGANLPSDDVTFRWIHSQGLKVPFYNAFFEAYQQAHPNITVQHDSLPWTEVNRLVPLGIQNGNAHNVFAMPQDIPASQAVKEGWVAPLDDIIPNFEEWKGGFPATAFVNGVHVFDGKTYTFPHSSSKRYDTMTFYNREYLEKAGYDLEAGPLTWDQYREAARKVTEQGQGQYYGVIFGAQTKLRLESFVRNLARMAGASAGSSLGFDDIDWRTGEFQYTSEQYIAAVELLLGLKQDGSVFPGSNSLDQAKARAQFPNGVAGLMLQGPWVIPQWQNDNPDFDFGLTSQPVPDSGEPTPLTYEETGANFVWVYANSPYKQIAGDMFSYLGSLNGQVALMALTRGNLRAVLPEAVRIAQEQVDLDPVSSQALTLYDEQLRLGPVVTIRNPAASQVAFEKQPLTPDFGDILQGVLVEQITDVPAAMQDLQDRSNAELDRAIKAAQDKGAEVSRNDFVFTNWNPSEEYTQERYEEVQG